MRNILLASAAILFAASFGAPPAYAAGGGGGYYGDFESRPEKPNPFRDARRKIAKKQYAEAIPLLKTALADKPNDADILNHLGFASRMIGKFDDSLDYYKRALAIEPDHKDAREYLGELYLQTRNPQAAKEQLAELVRLCPKKCSQRRTLEESIAKYEPEQAAPAAAPPT